MNASFIVSVVAVALVAAAGAAAAHASYPSDDDQVMIVVGQLGEPVYTYQKTGLDLILRENTTERKEIGGANGTLEAVLIAPGGEELSLPLQPQHGQVGRYTFTAGYTLTQPGLYKLRLKGAIGTTPVDATYNMAHEIVSQSDIMFPDKGLPTIQEMDEDQQALQARIADLETELVATKGRLQELNTAIGTVAAAVAEEEEARSPGPGTVLPLLAVAGVALWVARRRR